MINNEPRTLSSHVYLAPFFTSEECDAIVAMGDDWVEGQVMRFGHQVTDRENRSVTISKKLLPDDLLEHIFQKIFTINRHTFKYHLHGYEQSDLPRIFRYSAERKDHYTWHRDCFAPSVSNRKLSFSIQLTDPTEYDGGILEFTPDIKDMFTTGTKKGSIILFNPLLTHRVTPVTRGVRHAIVGWIHGPEFT